MKSLHGLRYTTDCADLIQLAGANHSPININIRGGTYWLIDPLILTPADSGTDQAPVTYQAFGSEKPVISAGRPVRGWALSTRDRARPSVKCG